MVEVLQAKLEQNPRLSDAIAKRGGIEWLENCTNITNAQDQKWEGKGKESAFVRALSEAYANVVEKSSEQSIIQSSQKNIYEKINTQETKEPVSSADITSLQVQTAREVTSGINFNSRSSDPLGGVLTSTTVKSKQVGTIEGEYPVSFRDNKAMPAGNYGLETYTQAKGEGQPFLSAEQAFYAYKETLPLGEPRVQLMAQILTARFEQHPRLVEAVTKRGGVEWLENCSYKVSSENTKGNFWEGEGLKSPYVRAIAQAYTSVIEKNQVQEQSPIETEAPSPSQDKPTTAAQPQFQEILPQKQVQQPDIEQALASPTSSSKRQVGAMEGIIERMKANTVQNLQDWYVAAQQLGKGEKYLSRIQEVTDLYIKENISLENAFTAMEKDLKALEKVNEMTSLAQRVVKTIGQEDVNGIMSVETQNYKIATKAQDKTYLVKDKEDNVLLYVKEGKTQVNQINDEIVQNFRFMNFRIDNSLKEVKQDLVER